MDFNGQKYITLCKLCETGVLEFKWQRSFDREMSKCYCNTNVTIINRICLSDY